MRLNHGLNTACHRMEYEMYGKHRWSLFAKDDEKVLALSEHEIFSCELHKLRDFNSEYLCMAKASKHLNAEMFGTVRSHGGCAILWYKSIANHVTTMPELGTDRMCVIRIDFPGISPMTVVAVYLPHQSCAISDSEDELEQLGININDCTSNGEVMIIGDTNVLLGPEYGLQVWGTTSKNGKLFMKTMIQCQMNIIDIGEEASGPVYTLEHTKGRTYIDHHLVTNGLSPAVSKNLSSRRRNMKRIRPSINYGWPYLELWSVSDSSAT